MKPFFIISILSFLTISCSKETPLTIALESSIDKISKVMESPEKYELQILFTRINRDHKEKPVFIDFEFNVNDSVYFYPASTVKFPIALMALEKLSELKAKGIDINRKTLFKTKNDSTYTSIEKEITKIFAVSDNESYNRLFEFLGQDYINQHLSAKNIKGSIRHRLSSFNAANNHTLPVEFKNNPEDSIPLYRQTTIKNKLPPKLKLQKTLKGKAYVYNDTLIPRPKDFSKKNYLPLSALHTIMKRVHFPDLYSAHERFSIDEEDQKFVVETMAILPRTAGYDQDEYPDGYVKFFMLGDTKNDIPTTLKIYNKVGYAYGYLTDCAYIKDEQNNIEFLLSATIHVNDNQTYNDNQYEYDTIGIPFLAELGRTLYQQELSRR